MGAAIYNSAIPKPVHSGVSDFARRFAPVCRVLLLFSLVAGGRVHAVTVDWTAPAKQLAHKVVAVTGPGAVSVTFENRSTLSKKEADAIHNLLRANLEALGAREAKPEQAAASAAVTISENPQSYVWVAEIHQGVGESAVVMVTLPREDGTMLPHEAAPVLLRKSPLWAQEQRILDVLVLEEESGPKQIAVLDPERITIYRQQNGGWKPETTLAIIHARAWPRDMRGKVVPAKDHLLDAYLPGVVCRSTNGPRLNLNCRESDDPWPLVATPATSFPSFGGSPPPAIQLGGFYAATRNFFTGALAPGILKITTVPKFYSAAPLPRDKYVLWLFAALDGQVHLIDGVSDRAAKLGWGSDLTSIKTTCGVGWQVLATSATTPGSAGGAGASGDSVRAYEFPDRDAVAVSGVVDFAGEITALWTEPKGDTAIAVERNWETGDYEAFRLAVSCTQ